MMNHLTLRQDWRLRTTRLVGVAIVVGVRMLEAGEVPPPPVHAAQAARFVEQARRRRLAGDADGGKELLARAIESSAEFPAAHWQRGEIRRDGSWQPLEEVEKAARGDAALAEYSRLRDGYAQG